VCILPGAFFFHCAHERRSLFPAERGLHLFCAAGRLVVRRRHSARWPPSPARWGVVLLVPVLFELVSAAVNGGHAAQKSVR
jgi:hypothetical protein